MKLSFTLILTLTCFIGLAHNSQIREPSLADAIEKANHDADIYNARNAKAPHPQPVKLYKPKQQKPKLFKPKNEAERLKMIGEIWHIKGYKHETNIFAERE